MLRRSLVVLVALCLVVPVAAPAIAPASGGDAPTAATAKKKCKKGYKRVKGKCKKKKKKSSGNTYKGTPPEITVSVSGSTVTFKWSLSKCSATGLPASITEQTPLDKSNPARSQFRINKPLGADNLRVLGLFVAPTTIHGTATIFAPDGHQLCSASMTLRK